MENNRKFRYIFDPTSRKIYCPSCHHKTFVGMIDQETGEFLPEFGRCDREVKCGYIILPTYTKDSTLQYHTIKVKKKTSYHEDKLLIESLKYSNNLLIYMTKLFGALDTEKIVNNYFIGTAKDNKGTIFWQVDDQYRICGGKIICYNNLGKRTNNINWVHSILKSKNNNYEFNLKQCLFGLHLINNDKISIIALVESEKTACIMSIIFPQFLWMACGAKGEFKIEKLSPIKHRKIIAYPDCEIQRNGTTTYDEWRKKAETFNKIGFDIIVSDLLEIQATKEQKVEGIDIADFFMM